MPAAEENSVSLSLSGSRFWSKAGSLARESAAWEPPLLGIRDL
jgi:hypothetical protein